jgi:hypothetical protein
MLDDTRADCGSAERAMGWLFIARLAMLVP